MSTLEVNTIKPISGSSTVTLGESGDTIALASGASQTLATSTPAFSVTATSNQTIGSSNNTLVVFDIEEFDTDSAFTNTSGNYKFTVPSGKAGKYLISVSLNLQGSGVSSLIACRLQIYKNGSAHHQAQFHFQSHNANEATPSSAIIMDLAESDYIQVYALTATSSGGNVRVEESGVKTTRFCGHKLA